MSIIWVVLVCLLLFSRPSSVGAAPICINDQAGCSVPSLANLFDRVIQHSARMHSITNDLHSVFVSMCMQYMLMYWCIVILFVLFSWQLFYKNVKLEVCLILWQYFILFWKHFANMILYTILSKAKTYISFAFKISVKRCKNAQRVPFTYSTTTVTHIFNPLKISTQHFNEYVSKVL